MLNFSCCLNIYSSKVKMYYGYVDVTKFKWPNNDLRQKRGMSFFALKTLRMLRF